MAPSNLCRSSRESVVKPTLVIDNRELCFIFKLTIGNATYFSEPGITLGEVLTSAKLIMFHRKIYNTESWSLNFYFYV